jgi:hypothetical protein
MRSEHGTIVHTGDWKIDEDPVDGEAFDRESFDLLRERLIGFDRGLTGRSGSGPRRNVGT